MSANIYWNELISPFLRVGAHDTMTDENLVPIKTADSRINSLSWDVLRYLSPHVFQD